jgi:hypothetical protein
MIKLPKPEKKRIKISIHHNGQISQIAKRRKPSLKKIREFVDKTLGMWADNPEIDKAFEELEDKWRQWDNEMLF